MQDPISSVIQIIIYQVNIIYIYIQNIFIYNYTHNTFTGKKQVIVFRNTPNYEAVICELGSEMESFLNSVIELVKEQRKISYNTMLENAIKEDEED